MTTLTSCPTGTLDPYLPNEEMPWNQKRAVHLYRRLAFGANLSTIDSALQQNPLDLIDTIIDEAIALPPSTAPEWANMTFDDYENFNEQASEQYRERILSWVEDMVTNGFREKLAFFWSNHLVTKFESYLCGSYLYQYHKLLQECALGNFKDFIVKMGKTPAMLVFLNGVQNTKEEPNENYARELYELFTLGADNGYTQQDIVETARALTGFQRLPDGYCGRISYTFLTHDNGQKTIFGRTGNWGYDDVHDILFEEHGDKIAYYICKKIYTHFVSPQPDEVIITEMAMTFQENNFEIAPVLRQLFKSEHFFDEAIIGTQIKSPLEVTIQYVKETNYTYNDAIIEAVALYPYLLGQQIFNPPDVSGWKGNRTWINSTRLTGRWQSNDALLFYQYEQYPNDLLDFARDLTNDSNNPFEITKLITDHFIPNGLQNQSTYNNLTQIFKGDVPENYYENGEWNLYWDSAPLQIAYLIYSLSRLPEFQLT